MTRDIRETGVAGIAGFQLPIGIRKRKKKVDEMFELNGDLGVAETIAYFSGLDEESSQVIEGLLDESEYVKLAEMIKGGFAESALRAVIRRKVREIVRKKAGGEGYVLYSPNPGKKKGSKTVGEFPTKLAARRAELQRFPPKDPSKRERMKKDVEKLRKHPEKAAEKEKEWMKPGKAPSKPKKAKAPKKKTKEESLDRLIDKITESIFREERKGSEWDEYVGKLSKQAVLADKTFQSMQKNIAKKSEKLLKGAASKLNSVLGPAGFGVKDSDVKKDVEKGVMYLEFYVGDEEGTAEVGPFYVAVEDGYAKIDVSSGARTSMTRLKPDRGKALRAEMMSLEDELAADESVAGAVQKRDEYLRKMEGKVDKFVSDLNALEITMLKNVLVSKYRKIS